ncbi:MAG: sulfatase-like hydrolase/transferase [Planctomycetes bacterium]|nr:sulfatase-like hydrolase/transferase [Planctomycetota bacterium]
MGRGRNQRGLASLALAGALASCGGEPVTSGEKGGAAVELPPIAAEIRDRDWIFVSIDTLRADHLPFYGYELATAGDPTEAFSLAWLAEQGCVYDSVWAPVGKTMPSLASYWTGDFPLAHGAVANLTTLSGATWVQSFVAAGYRTHAAVANRVIGPGCGLERGFETYQVFPKQLEPTLPRELLQKADPVIQSKQPLMLWAHFMAPHQPYSPPAPFDAEFSERPKTPADNDALYAFHANPESLDDATRHAIIGLYDGEIRAASSYLQDLLRGLDNSYRAAGRGGLLEAATVVFFSDHGEELAERHGYFLHAKSLYRGVLHVPLVVAGKGISPGRASEPRSLMDVLPELLARQAPKREVWAASWQTEFYAMRDSRWTLIHNPANLRRGPYEPPEVVDYPYATIELYDRNVDPYELNNLAEKHPDEVSRLLGRMQSWYAAMPQAEVYRVPGSDQRQKLVELGYLDFADRVVPPWTIEQWEQD